MKKIVLLLIGLLLFSVSCKDNGKEEKKEPITGVWKPVKMVQTVVEANGTLGESQAYYYDECQQESRFTFNEDFTGHVTMKDTYGSLNCMLVQDESFTYNYDESTGKITLQYITLKDEGKISEITASSMNLQIDKIEGNVYTSKTYTLQRVN